MSKRYKAINTVSTLGDQHGEDTTIVWFNKCGQSVTTNNADEHDLKRIRINRYLNAGFKKGVQPSKLEDIYQKICAFITDKNPDMLVKLLKTDFIYPEKKSTQRQASNANHGDWYDITTETWAVRPIFEALFVDNFDYFCQFVNLMIKEKPSFFQAFLNGKAHTDLDNDSLFRWNPKIQDEITAKFEQIRDYGSSLRDSGDQIINRKADLTFSMANDLLEKVMHKTALQDNDVESQFETLSFKLELLQTLQQHSKTFYADQELSGHMKEARSILFTPEVANLYNYTKEGSFLFFNNPKVQQTVLAHCKTFSALQDEQITQSPG